MAKNAALLMNRHPQLTVTNTVGDYGGRLSDRGERIALSKPDDMDLPYQDFVLVDEVAYSDGWAKWTDGGGSSLELADPDSDNRSGMNWVASDETAKPAISLSHVHDPNDPACCVAHGPNAQQISTITSWREAVPIVLSIGIRPCSGGVLVLLVAEAMDLRAAGIGAVFAMAVGTALTVSILALSSVFLRKFATFVVRSDGRTVQTAGHLVTLAGGGVILLMGLALFFDSLKPSAAPVF